VKLGELARDTGVSTATIKYWIREGILPPGALRNQTTAVYGPAHADRIRLIRTLREQFDLPIGEIRELTRLIDDPAVPLLSVLESCQLIATGLRPAAPSPAARARVDEVIARAGWPAVPSVARDALAAELDCDGREVPIERLVQYARALGPFAEHDVRLVQPGGPGARSRDAVARDLLVGAAQQVRLLLAMNQLAHTSAAIAHADERRA